MESSPASAVANLLWYTVGEESELEQLDVSTGQRAAQTVLGLARNRLGSPFFCIHHYLTR